MILSINVGEQVALANKCGETDSGGETVVVKMHEKRRIVFGVLSVLWMIVIFLFSADAADESSKKSSWVGFAIARIIESDFDTWTAERQVQFVENIEYPIRKAGHATEYAILGFLLMGAMMSKEADGDRRRWRFLLIWGIAALYAASDEFHQLFVEGRSCQLSDVVLDSTGALAGMAAYSLAGRLVRRLVQR